ncbi:cellulose synthase operon protein YhjQ [Rhodovarius crocodyli]|uniref:Cellulose synthase operon protein YhjQ n=1 Tax=Rhodovarius crocodyli TaxID=1979269 RepID=A0A437MML9_9PROT|nr:cellulose synthase operon protein YhjQ/BcsQ [Rhodovarius crocodyli]RVT98879.1 cellulose synthase operon protein YhjQ [Rhodovarius crocodyli]
MPLIAVASPKGGVGKTTLTAHLAALLAAKGYRVLAMDLDPQNALRLHLGVSIRDEGGFLAHLSERGNWRQSLRHTDFGVQLLPYGAADPAEVLDIQTALAQDPGLLAEPVREMLKDPELLVLVDSPPGPSAALASLYPLIDHMLVVLLADGGSASLMPQIVSGRFMGRGSLIERLAEKSMVVINQFERGAPLPEAVLDLATKTLGHRLLGVVARDAAVMEALASKRLLTEGGRGAAEDMAVLADAFIRRTQLRRPGERRSGGFSALNEWGA